MRIGIHFDGVIVDIISKTVTVAREYFHVRVGLEQVALIGNFLTPDQREELRKAVYEQRVSALSVKEVNGAPYHIPLLIASGHEVVAFTSRSGSSLEIGQEWSRRHGLKFLKFVGGVNCDRARAVAGCDVYVDDDLDKLISLVDAVPHLFLFSWGYKKQVDTSVTPIQRVHSWAELYKKIKALTGGH
ncbi:MAG: hypothetical protein AAB581_02420 [Patescibacteria group bacterium]